MFPKFVWLGSVGSGYALYPTLSNTDEQSMERVACGFQIPENESITNSSEKHEPTAYGWP
jgi:hypothetical protein